MGKLVETYELEHWVSELKKAEEHTKWIEYQITKTKMEIRDMLYHQAGVVNQQRKEKDERAFYIIGAEIVNGVSYLELEAVFDVGYTKEDALPILVPLNYFEDEEK